VIATTPGARSREVAGILAGGEASFHAVLKSIGHGHEFDVLVGLQGLGGCPRPAPAA